VRIQQSVGSISSSTNHQGSVPTFKTIRFHYLALHYSLFTLHSHSPTEHFYHNYHFTTNHSPLLPTHSLTPPSNHCTVLTVSLHDHNHSYHVAAEQLFITTLSALQTHMTNTTLFRNDRSTRQLNRRKTTDQGKEGSPCVHSHQVLVAKSLTLWREQVPQALLTTATVPYLPIFACLFVLGVTITVQVDFTGSVVAQLTHVWHFLTLVASRNLHQRWSQTHSSWSAAVLC